MMTRIIVFAAALIGLSACATLMPSSQPNHVKLVDNGKCEVTFSRRLTNTGLSTTSRTLSIPVARGESEQVFVHVRDMADKGTHAALRISGDLSSNSKVFELIGIPVTTDRPTYDAMRPLTQGTPAKNDIGPRKFAVDFHIPNNTVPDQYAVDIDSAGCSGTVRIDVFDVVKPIDNNWIIQATVDPVAPHFSPTSTIDLALRHGINSFVGVFPRATGEPDHDSAIVNQVGGMLDNPSVKHFRLPLSQYHRGSTFVDRHGGPLDIAKFEALLVSELRPYQPILNNDTYRQKLLIKLWDEPVAENYGEVSALYSTARQQLPGIPLEITEQPERELEGSADIWTVYIDYLSEQDVLDQKAAGNKILLYANSIHSIASHSDHMRTIGWLLWRYELDGYHIWRLNWWNEDPWVTSSSWKTDFDKTGTLIYPGQNGDIYPSVRLVAFRDGLDDALLLQELEDCSEQSKVARWLSDVRSNVFSDSASPLGFDLYSKRAELLAMLEDCNSMEYVH